MDPDCMDPDCTPSPSTVASDDERQSPAFVNPNRAMRYTPGRHPPREEPLPFGSGNNPRGWLGNANNDPTGGR